MFWNIQAFRLRKCPQLMPSKLFVLFLSAPGKLCGPVVCSANNRIFNNLPGTESIFSLTEDKKPDDEERSSSLKFLFHFLLLSQYPGLTCLLKLLMLFAVLRKMAFASYKRKDASQSSSIFHQKAVSNDWNIQRQ